MDLKIIEFDSEAVTDQEIDHFHEFRTLLLAERIPEDAPPPVGASVKLLRDPAPNQQTTGFAAIQDGRWTAVALAIATDGDDKTLRLDLGVLAEHRRRGIASELLDRVVRHAESTGKNLLIGDTFDRVSAGTSFAERVGAEPGLSSHVNRLALADVDRAEMQRWIDEGPTRAPAYELVGWDGRTPDDLLDQVAGIINVMNDAPSDDLDVDLSKVTPEMLRAFEEVGLSSGTEVWWLVARERATGLVVGETDVRWHPSRPDRISQGFTVVRRDHRGYALGKWLKATMVLRILDERPDVVDICTSNADSNDAMVGINRAMGYLPYIGTTTWQVPVEVARQRLGLSP